MLQNTFRLFLATTLNFSFVTLAKAQIISNETNDESADVNSKDSIIVDESDDTEPVWQGAIGPLRIGIMLSAEIPSFLHYSVESRFLRYFGAGVGFGGFGNTISGVRTQSRHWDARLRYFPFSGSFYMGLGIGSQMVSAQMQTPVVTSQETIDSKWSGSYKRLNCTPAFGWHAIWENGFNLNFSLGWQMAARSSSNFTFDSYSATSEQRERVKESGVYKENERKIKYDIIDKLSGKPLPHVGLGVGWMI
jgi:hypothetical protein